MRTVPVIRGAGGSVAGGTSLRGRPDHAGADRDGDRQDGGDRGAGHHGAAALDPTGARADVGDGERGALQGIGGAVQRVVHLVLEGSGAHRASSPDSWGLRECGARARSAASARLAWDFTVPTEMPEHVGDLGLAQLLVVAQHDDRALLGRQGLDEDHSAPPMPSSYTSTAPVSGIVVGRVLAALPRPPPQRVVLVDHDPSDVAVEGLAVADVVPRQVELGERRLEQVLGAGVVAGEEVRRAGSSAVWRAAMYAENSASLSACQSCLPMSTSVALIVHLLSVTRVLPRGVSG